MAECEIELSVLEMIFRLHPVALTTAAMKATADYTEIHVFHCIDCEIFLPCAHALHACTHANGAMSLTCVLTSIMPCGSDLCAHPSHAVYEHESRVWVGIQVRPTWHEKGGHTS